MARPIVITGGGTGGHIFPMVAVAQALEASGISATEIRLVGSRRGQERRLLASSRYPVTLLPGRGLRRSFSPEAFLKNLGAVAGLTAGLLRAVVSVGLWRPRCVVSVGGYASFPASAAAVFWRRPLVLLELDAASGAAHRAVEKFATKRCAAFPSESPSTVVTGAPLRDEIVTIDRSPQARATAKSHFTPPLAPERTVVVVMTGSLGATSVNNAVVALAAMWSERTDIALLHVTGQRDFAAVESKKPETNGLDYRVIAFGDMTSLWSVADVAVCRAGAATLGELTALAIPSVLVPLPRMNDHQMKNALVLQRAGATVIVPDAECTAASLEAAISSVCGENYQAMSNAAASLGHLHAAAAIAAVVAEVAR